MSQYVHITECCVFSDTFMREYQKPRVEKVEDYPHGIAMIFFDGTETFSTFNSHESWRQAALAAMEFLIDQTA